MSASIYIQKTKYITRRCRFSKPESWYKIPLEDEGDEDEEKILRMEHFDEINSGVNLFYILLSKIKHFDLHGYRNYDEKVEI